MPTPRTTCQDVVVGVHGLSKRFVIRKEKSLKERLVNFGRSNLYKEDFWALKDIDLEIAAGTTVGVIGANGSGKSTLLKSIGGIIAPTEGEVVRRGRVAALLELGAGFHPDLTGRENVYLNASILGLKKKQVDEFFEAIVEFSGIERFIDTQVKFYSSGMYVRLAFAVAVHVDPEILLVDEVLAVGDEPFQRKCMDRIRAFQREGKTIVLVTHSLDIVGTLCNRVIVLEEGRIVYDGEPGEGVRILRDGFEHERHEQENGTPAPNDSPATIVSTRLIDVATGEDAALVGAGASIRAEILVRVHQPLQDCVIGLGIDTPLGQVVFATSTERLKLPRIDLVPGEHTVTFNLPEVRLGSGQYFLNTTFGTIETGELIRMQQAASWEVDDATENSGVLSVAATAAVV
ncbi:MAG TPA: ABC transporter ATP-binding protein [Marmoricola sp.]|nr:ABC transporter ATP-binding protein [Marmoricola sp.]